MTETTTLSALRLAREHHAALLATMPDFLAQTDASNIECHAALALVPTSDVERVALINLFLAFQNVPESTARTVLDSLRVGCLPLADRAAAELERFVFIDAIVGTSDANADLDCREHALLLDIIARHLARRKDRGALDPIELVRRARLVQQE